MMERVLWSWKEQLNSIIWTNPNPCETGMKDRNSTHKLPYCLLDYNFNDLALLSHISTHLYLYIGNTGIIGNMCGFLTEKNNINL